MEPIELWLIDSGREIDRTNQPDCADVARMVETTDHLPDDSAALKAALIETRAKLVGAQALIEHLRIILNNLVSALEHELHPAKVSVSSPAAFEVGPIE